MRLKARDSEPSSSSLLPSCDRAPRGRRPHPLGGGVTSARDRLRRAGWRQQSPTQTAASSSSSATTTNIIAKVIWRPGASPLEAFVGRHRVAGALDMRHDARVDEAADQEKDARRNDRGAPAPAPVAERAACCRRPPASGPRRRRRAPSAIAQFGDHARRLSDEREAGARHAPGRGHEQHRLRQRADCRLRVDDLVEAALAGRPASGLRA